MPTKYKDKYTDYFWEKVAFPDSIGTDECWEWRGLRYKRGYGRFTVNGKRVMTHRLSYQICCGPIPEGMLVCHHCDNPSCVNPSHLFVGTDKDNVQDCINKGRHYSTIKHRLAIQNGYSKPKRTVIRQHKLPKPHVDLRAKLTVEQVLEIRSQYEEGISIKNLAKEFSISYQQAHHIIKRYRWTNI